VEIYKLEVRSKDNNENKHVLRSQLKVSFCKRVISPVLRHVAEITEDAQEQGKSKRIELSAVS
jgi:hypothetical protein